MAWITRQQPGGRRGPLGRGPVPRRPLSAWLPLTLGTTLAAAGVGGLGAGCVERTMTIESDPPGALVYLNDQEVGRTPLTRDFFWYGNYDMQLRKEGFETIKTHKWVVAPYYQWVPFDLLSELAPVTLRNHKTLRFKLEPTTRQATPEELVGRGEKMRGELESSPSTRQPLTRPSATTRPSNAPARAPGNEPAVPPPGRP